jgi:hypothetical protein
LKTSPAITAGQLELKQPSPMRADPAHRIKGQSRNSSWFLATFFLERHILILSAPAWFKMVPQTARTTWPSRFLACRGDYSLAMANLILIVFFSMICSATIRTPG